MKKINTRPSGKTRVLVVDDHPLFREGIVQFITRQPDIEVSGEADSVAGTYAELKKNQPDLILLDLRLGQSDGIELIKSLKAQYPELLILVISQHDEGLFAERSIRAGASGYVMKQEATEEVLSAIRTVLAGDLYISRRIAALVFRKTLDEKLAAPRAGVEKLSDRELQVFQMLGAGMTTRKISMELKLSLKTIESHRENIKHKLGYESGGELVRGATEWVQHILPTGSQGDLSVPRKRQ